MALTGPGARPAASTPHSLPPQPLLLLLLLLAAGCSSSTFQLVACQAQQTQPEPVPAPCPTRCSTALAYIVTPEQQQTLGQWTLRGIAADFHADLVALVAANNEDLGNLDALGDAPVQPGQEVRVPLPGCSCKDGGGGGGGGNYSADGVTYEVKSGDSLSGIALGSYFGLVGYPAIAAANGISNPDLIQPGQVFTIPIPCTCVSPPPASASSSSPAVVAISYRVATGDDYASIAREFNTAAAAIASLNPTVNASALAVDQVIQVPLSACSFNLSADSPDAGLLVPYDAYAITADGCIQCTCSSDDDGLRASSSCTPSPTSLPCAKALTCAGTNLTIGSSSVVRQQQNGSSSGSSCDITTCLYAGYNETHILTRVEQRAASGDACSERPTPPPPAAPPRPIGAPPPALSPPGPRDGGGGPRSPPPPGGSSSSTAPPPSSSARRTDGSVRAAGLAATWLPAIALLFV